MTLNGTNTTNRQLPLAGRTPLAMAMRILAGGIGLLASLPVVVLPLAIHPSAVEAQEPTGESLNLCHYDGWVLGSDLYPDEAGLETISAFNPRTHEVVTLVHAQTEADDFFTDITFWDGKIYIYNVPDRILVEVDPSTGQSTKLPIPNGIQGNLRGDGWGVLPDGTFLSAWEFSTRSGRRKADTIMRHDFSVDPPQSEPWFYPATNFGDLVFVPPNQVWGTERGSRLTKFEVDPETFEVISRTDYGVPSSPDGGHSMIVSWSAHFPNHLIGVEERDGNGEMRLIDISVDPPVASAPIATAMEPYRFLGAEMLADSINMDCVRSLELVITDSIDQSDDFTKAGDVINYTAIVANTGTVPLYNLALDGIGTDTHSLLIEDNTDLDADGRIDSLAPEDSATITFSYSVTQADIDSGQVSLSASAIGSTLAGLTVADRSDDPDDPTDLDTEDDSDPDDPTVSPLQGPPPPEPTTTNVDSDPDDPTVSSPQGPPPPEPTPTDDVRTGILPGQPATIDPLANDGTDLLPTSVRLVDPVTARATMRVDTLEGTWTVDATTGRVTFTPAAGFSGSTASISYLASPREGNDVIQATIRLEYAPPILAVTGGSTATTLIGAAALILAGFALRRVRQTT